MLQFDVVIAAKDVTDTLGACCKALREIAYLNNLIIVVGKSKDSTIELAEEYGDIVVQDHGEGIGEAREVGLKNVKTKFFAFVDADVIVTRAWGKWCLETIELPDVGACEGVAYPTGKYCAMFVKESLAKKGEYYCTLSSTMLKTEVVREVEIPHLRWGEDWALRRRIWAAGYKWIVNANLRYAHLCTDWKRLRHSANWNPYIEIPTVKLLAILLGSPLCLFRSEWVEGEDRVPMEYYSLGQKIYHMLAIWASSYGYMEAKGKHCRKS